MSGIHIVDETNDKKYFSIIPNYIVNHSDHWEQSLYLVMKRLAGENGTCFASSKTMASMMGASQSVILKTIKKLETRGWIKCTGMKPGKTHPVPEYEMVDLWELNTDYYKKLKKEKIASLETQSPDNTKDRITTDAKIAPVEVREEYIYKKNNKESIERKYSKVEDVTETDLQEIAKTYNVPLSFVRSKYDDMVLWVGSKPYDKRIKGRNWRMTLMNWVKRDALKIMERRHNDPKSGIDARNI